MSEQTDTILLVEDDPDIRAVLRDQVLSSASFAVLEASDGPDALALLRERSPDLILLDLTLPALSGHDMLVALASQGYHGPLIVLAEASSARLVIEAFRLGATDYVTKPPREAEVLAAVERGLAQVRLRRERDALLTWLRATNQQLETRVHQLTTLSTVGKSVIEMRELNSLFERVLDGALSVTGADYGYLLLRDDKTGRLILRAGRNLPIALLDHMGEPMDDPLASLALTSREPVRLAGDQLRRFTSARNLYAAACVPLTVQMTAVGALVIGNDESQAAFDASTVPLLQSLADYATIAIVNARLFAMLDQRARTSEIRSAQAIVVKLRQPLAAMGAELRRLVEGGEGPLPRNVAQRLDRLRQQVEALAGQLSRHQE
jgi:two-component system NtrC family sensor kinase